MKSDTLPLTSYKPYFNIHNVTHKLLKEVRCSHKTMCSNKKLLKFGISANENSKEFHIITLNRITAFMLKQLMIHIRKLNLKEHFSQKFF